MTNFLQKIVTHLLSMDTRLLPALLFLSIKSTVALATNSEPLVIENIRCEGNKTTRCSFITRKYYQDIGERVDPTEIADARLRLNTMPQFYYARARLEKGSQKGRVIVVFVVVEAPHINYDFSAGAIAIELEESRALSTFEYNSTTLSGSAQVSTNNFLGWGKTAVISYQHNANSFESTDNFPGNSLHESRRYSIEGDSNLERLQLSYYDPYVLGSRDYFLNGSLYTGKSKFNAESVSERYVNDTSVDIISRARYNLQDRDTFNGYSLALGKNIARFSYVDIELSKDDDQDHAYAVGAGWNTEDHLTFATSGERFDLRYRQQDRFEYLSTNYNKNFAIRQHHVLNLGGGASYFFGDSTFSDSTTLSLSARYSVANVLERSKGRFSGWYIQTSLSGNDERNSLDIARLSAGYTRQANGVNFDLSLAYQYQGEL